MVLALALCSAPPSNGVNPARQWRGGGGTAGGGKRRRVHHLAAAAVRHLAAAARHDGMAAPAQRGGTGCASCLPLRLW